MKLLTSDDSSSEDEGRGKGRSSQWGLLGVRSSAAAPPGTAGTRTTYLTYGGREDDSGSDDDDFQAQLRRLKARASQKAMGGGQKPSSSSAAGVRQAAGGERRPAAVSQRQQQQQQQDDSDSSTEDEDDGGGSPRTRVRPAPSSSKHQRKEAAKAKAAAAAIKAPHPGSDSESTTEGEEEETAAGVGRGVPKGFLSRKRPRPPSSSARAAAAAAAVARRPRPSTAEGEEEDSSSDEDGDGGELYPTIRNPLELGALEPLVLAAQHPDDDDEEEEDEMGGGKTQGAATPAMVPAAANRYLQEYQRDGVRWLFKCYRGSQGCVIGDEMGLGKTIQVICFLLALFKKQGRSDADKQALRAHTRLARRTPKKGHCALLVVPSSLQQQWQQELLKWGRFAVTVLKNPREAAQQIEDAAKGVYEVALCTYGFIKGQHKERLQEVRWRVVVFDEFHQCKNKSSEAYGAAKALEARMKVGLTGTPIQNNLEELWALLSIVASTLAGEEATFKKEYSNPIKRQQKRTASAEVVERGEVAKEQMEALLNKVLLARDKRTIQHKLHGKQEFVVFCKLTDIQYDVYRNVLALPEFALLKRRREPCDCGRRDGRARGECCYRTPTVRAAAAEGAVLPSARPSISPKALIWRKMHPDGTDCDRCPSCLTLPCLSRLQKVANHPCLLQYNPSRPAGASSNGGNGQQAAKEEKAYTTKSAQLAFGKHCAALGGVERSGNILELRSIGMKACGKLRALDGLLGTFGRRDKVLLFSFSVQMLDVLAAYATTKGYDYVRLDGQTTDRDAVIQRFHQDPNKTLFLISSKAGGLGLNLAVACKVVIFDVNWNPTHDLQAMDRAYRLGQTRNVEVYRLVAQGTIEELCYMRQIYKQQLSDLALDGVTTTGGTSSPSKKKTGRKKKAATEGIRFDSVQGHKGEEGELFGVENLLQLSRGSILQELRRTIVDGGAEAAAASSSAAAAVAGAEEGEEEEVVVKPTTDKEIAQQMEEVLKRAADHLRRKAKKKGGGGEVDGGGSQSQGAGFDAEMPAEQVLELLGIPAVVSQEEEEEDEIEEASSSEGEGKGRGKGGRGGRGKGPGKPKMARIEEDESSGEEMDASPSPSASSPRQASPAAPAAVAVAAERPKPSVYKPSYL